MITLEIVSIVFGPAITIALFFIARQLSQINRRHAVFVKCLSGHAQGIFVIAELSLECGYAAVKDGHNGKLPGCIKRVEEFKEGFREFQCDQAAEAVVGK